MGGNSGHLARPRARGGGPSRAPLGRVGAPSPEPPRLQLPLFPHRRQQVRRLRKQEAPSHHRKRVRAASPPPAHCKTPTAPSPQAPTAQGQAEKRSGRGQACGAARPTDASPHPPQPGRRVMSSCGLGGPGLPRLQASGPENLWVLRPAPGQPEPGLPWPLFNQNMGSGVTEKPFL